jgi:hypothetical protein
MPKLSYEGLVGTVIALVVVILDQAGVKNPYVLWVAFALAVGLCLDATIRSALSTRRKAWGSGIVVLVFVLFGIYLLRQSRLKPEAMNNTTQTPVIAEEKKTPPPPTQNTPEVKPIPKAKPPKAPSVSLSNQIATGAPTQPPLSQECAPGAYCAQSTGQQGGITGQVFINTRPHFVITDEQQLAIGQAMKPFSGHKALILVNGNATDASEFGQRLASALRAVGVDATSSQGEVHSMDGSATPPLLVQYGDNDADMGQALLKAIVDNHIWTGQIGHRYYEGKPGGQLMVVVTPVLN